MRNSASHAPPEPYKPQREEFFKILLTAFGISAEGKPKDQFDGLKRQLGDTVLAGSTLLQASRCNIHMSPSAAAEVVRVAIEKKPEIDRARLEALKPFLLSPREYPHPSSPS